MMELMKAEDFINSYKLWDDQISLKDTCGLPANFASKFIEFFNLKRFVDNSRSERILVFVFGVK